ncbi:MAG: hypothetical protein ACLR8L_10150 [Oscillospiraceae bacterium]
MEKTEFFCTGFAGRGEQHLISQATAQLKGEHEKMQRVIWSQLYLWQDRPAAAFAGCCMKIYIGHDAVKDGLCEFHY